MCSGFQLLQTGDPSWTCDESTIAINGNDQTDNFFRIFGDVNGDGKVDNADLCVFNAVYGKRSNQSGYLGYLDFDGNG